MKKALLLASAITVLLLSACTDTAQPTQESIQDPTTQPAATQSSTDTPTTPTTQNEADSAAYSGALQLRDESFCDKIGDDAYKQECKVDVKDQIAMTEAVAKQNEGLCDQLSTEDKKAACKIQVEVETTRAEDLRNRDVQYNKDTSMLDDIILTKSFEKCEDIIVEDLKYICNINAISYEAATKKDASLCDSIELTTDKDLCISAVKDAQGN